MGGATGFFSLALLCRGTGTAGAVTQGIVRCRIDSAFEESRRLGRWSCTEEVLQQADAVGQVDEPVVINISAQEEIPGRTRSAAAFTRDLNERRDEGQVTAGQGGVVNTDGDDVVTLDQEVLGDGNFHRRINDRFTLSLIHI